MPLTPLNEFNLVGLLSVLAFVLGIGASMHLGRARPYALAASLIGSLLYAWIFSGRLGWFAILPATAVVALSNLMPVLLSFTAALAYRTQRLRGWRRPVTTALFALLAIGFIVTPTIRASLAPMSLDPRSQWHDGVCLQSHPSTCGPAAGATLMHLHGIRTSERILARLCFTSQQGTEPLRLFCGLAAASQDQPILPAIASADPRCWAELNQFPNIALIRFEQSDSKQRMNRLLGPRGEGHAVVVLGRIENGGWQIADPAFGKTTWTDDQFQNRFTGDAIYLSLR